MKPMAAAAPNLPGLASCRGRRGAGGGRAGRAGVSDAGSPLASRLNGTGSAAAACPAPACNAARRHSGAAQRGSTGRQGKAVQPTHHEQVRPGAHDAPHLQRARPQQQPEGAGGRKVHEALDCRRGGAIGQGQDGATRQAGRRRRSTGRRPRSWDSGAAWRRAAGSSPQPAAGACLPRPAPPPGGGGPRRWRTGVEAQAGEEELCHDEAHALKQL